jgi:2-polyprenyl-3-methyl-5-hydroxy-6-metoxy-1,4-benzoquinol methylase
MTAYKDYGFSSAKWSCIHKYLLDPIVQILSRKKDRKILDIGCGNGWMTNHLIGLGYDVYATDASPTGIEIARMTNPDRFFLQDLTENELPGPLRQMSFNTILSTEVIEHLYAPREYLDFCKKILVASGGGELILSTPYHGYLKNLVLSLSGQMDRHFTVLWDGGHIKFWSRKTLSGVLTERGFGEVQFTGCGRLPYMWKSMILSSQI